MSTILNQLRASGGTDAIISVIELQCEAWTSPIAICNGFVDIFVTTELGYGLEAVATGMDVALPRKDNTGAQNLKFAIDNVREQAEVALRQALSDQHEVRIIYRQYVSSDLEAPADNPVHMVVKQVVRSGSTIEITAGFFSLIDTQFPRDVYTSDFAPGLKYLD